jgi:tRNA 2-selenouridine synthase
MPWRELSVEQLNIHKEPLLIDVRSPIEHEAECLPDSINVPLLSNDERAEVGTVYKQQGEMVARRYALKFIAPKVPSIINQIAALHEKHGQQIVIYCWRGGLRSEAVASLLSIAGISCSRLTGGYKAWRRQVLNDFAQFDLAVTPVILHGTTGCGKTEILLELEQVGLQIIDLECLANHRGSVFGGMGLSAQPTQKNFEGSLWQKLCLLKPDFVFMEAESRKIGCLSLPDLFFKKLIHGGINILVTGSLERRAERIASDYLKTSSEDDFSESLELLSNLRERLGAKKLNEIKDLVLARNIQMAIELILSHYYDPLYQTQIERAAPFELEVSGDDRKAAAEEITRWLPSQSLFSEEQRLAPSPKSKRKTEAQTRHSE